jgi:hypothetical protein
VLKENPFRLAKCGNSDYAKLNMKKKADAKKVTKRKAVNRNWKECKVWDAFGDDHEVMMVYRDLSSRKWK